MSRNEEMKHFADELQQLINKYRLAPDTQCDELTFVDADKSDIFYTFEIICNNYSPQHTHRPLVMLKKTAIYEANITHEGQ